MYHLSDIKNYNRCKRLFYLSLENKEVYQPYLRNDEVLSELVIRKLGINEYFLGQKGDDKERFFDNLDRYSWFVKARFEFDCLRIKIPFLKKENHGFIVYFLFVGNYPQSLDINYYACHIWVLRQLGLNILDVKIIYLNTAYKRQQDLDPDQLFFVDDYLYTSKNQRSDIRVFEAIEEKMIDLRPFMKQMNELTDPAPQKSRSCKARGLCRFYYQCFDEQDLPDNSILTLVSSKYKNKMFNDGILYLKDADPSLLEGTRLQYAQIMADRNGGIYLDYEPLKAWMKGFAGATIAFIDFEWERYLIPPYDKLKPYDAVCFEYSLHILKRDCSLVHYDFLGTKDCRVAFIESLIKNIPEDAKIVAYNSIGAEELRLKELAEQFPEYRDYLLNLISRFSDLAYPFINGLVYDVRMAGNFSVKSLLRVVSDFSYDDLAIHDGMDAVFKWRNIDQGQEGTDLVEIEQELLEYCSLDSYSLVLIFKWLNKILNNSSY